MNDLRMVMASDPTVETVVDLLANLVAFPTESRSSNLDLVDLYAERAAAAAPKKPAAADLEVSPREEKSFLEIPEEFEDKGAEETSEAEGTASPAKSTYRVRLILLVKRGQADSPQGQKRD